MCCSIISDSDQDLPKTRFVTDRPVTDLDEFTREEFVERPEWP